MNNIPLYEYINMFIHSSVDSHLSCFHFGSITNNASVNIHIQVLWGFFCGNMSSFLLDNLGMELIVATLGGVKWYLDVFLICSSLMVNDIELLFIVLIGRLYISLEKCLFKSFVHSKNWVISLFIVEL